VEQLLELLVHAVVVWPAVLGCLAALAIVGVASIVHPLPAGAWFASGFVGSAVGVVLQIKAASKRGPSPRLLASNLTWFQKVLLLLVVATLGGSAGYAVEQLIGPATAVVCVLVGPVVLGPALGAPGGERVTPLSVFACSAASLLGYFAPRVIEWLFAHVGA
jgi:hypothetical protein